MDVFNISIFREREESFICKAINSTGSAYPFTLRFSEGDSIPTIDIFLKSEKQVVEFKNSVLSAYKAFAEKQQLKR